MISSHFDQLACACNLFRNENRSNSAGISQILDRHRKAKENCIFGSYIISFQTIPAKNAIKCANTADNVRSCEKYHSSTRKFEITIDSICLESKLRAKIVTEDEKETLHHVELKTRNSLRGGKLSVEQFREKVIDRLVQFLKNRFEDENKELLYTLDAFLKFDSATAVPVQKVHELVGKDLDLASLYVQFGELCEAKQQTQ